MPFVSSAPLRNGILDDYHHIARRETVAGAGLDVYGDELLPPPAAIASVPNTVLTRHVGDVTEEAYSPYYPQALEDVEAWLAGRPIRVIAPDSASAHERQA